MPTEKDKRFVQPISQLLFSLLDLNANDANVSISVDECVLLRAYAVGEVNVRAVR